MVKSNKKITGFFLTVYITITSRTSDSIQYNHNTIKIRLNKELKFAQPQYS